jgi:hypothetical protein
MLHTDHGVYMRDVRTASGYISGDAARVHFGIPDDTYVQRLDIRWADGAVSTIATPPQDVMLWVIRG